MWVLYDKLTTDSNVLSNRSLCEDSSSKERRIEGIKVYDSTHQIT